MAYTDQDLKAQLVDYVNTNPGWTWLQWNDETRWLGLHHKFDDQLVALQVMYTAKLKRIYQHYKEIFDILKYGVSESFIQATSEDDIIDLKAIKTKVMRIARKWRGVNAEIAGRAAGFFGPGLTYDRNYVGTLYYIDLDGGNDGADGLSIGQAWLTISQYVNVTTRSPGDIAYVRANTSEVRAASISVDDDGSEDARIYLIGCDSVINDPWGDASDVKPIIDLNSASIWIEISGDNFWNWERLEIKNGGNANGNIFYRNYSTHWRFVDCDFSGNAVAANLIISGASHVIFDGCTSDGANTQGWSFEYSSQALLINCTADGNAVGVGSKGGSFVELIDCLIGQTLANTTRDLDSYYGGWMRVRNTKWGSHRLFDETSRIESEDDQQVYGANKVYHFTGTVTKDTGVTRVGGASSSAKMEPNGDCGAEDPIALGFDHFEMVSPFKIWAAAALTAITVYIRSLGTWGTYPTADELYIEASYLDHAVDASRTKVQSNDVLADISSTVDSDSNLGQKVLNVAATTGFAVGDHILINEGGAREEQGKVYEIQAGVSLSLEDNLTYTHTSVQADAVIKEWFAFDVQFTPLQEGFVYLNVFLKKYEDAGDGCYVDIKHEIS